MFTSERDGNGEIYRMDGAGGGVLRLTNHPAADFLPAWSPDRSRVAFSSARDGNLEIYVMAMDGTGLARLTNAPTDDVTPEWSPDGRRIAFSRSRGPDQPNDLYVVDANGSNERWLGEGSNPSWSPDGRHIAFDKGSGENIDLYVMSADGSRIRSLTSSPGVDATAAWSSDGRKIAFGSNREGGVYHSYVMNPDGSGVRKLSPVPCHECDPQWSADDRRVFFGSEFEGDPEIYAVDVRTGSLRRVTFSPGLDAYHDVGDTLGPRVAISRRRARLGSRRLVRLRVACPAIEAGGCAGTVTLVRGKTRVGRGRFEIRAGRTERARVRLTRRAAALVVARRKLRVRALARAKDPAGNRRLTRERLTLIRPSQSPAR